MEHAALAVHQIAKAESITGISGADPAKVAEFEKLMRDGAMNAPGIDQYQSRIQSPMTELGADLMRIGSEMSRDFHVQAEQTNLRVASFDPADPLASLKQTVMLQQAAQVQLFRLQFATSLVQSVNQGFSTLFRLQG